MKKQYSKSIFLIIDALRYDIFENLKDSKFLYPTITKLALKGHIRKVVTNAQSTQFVLPALFSLTYPLDDGGYNFGIRYRKESYIETIKKKKKNLTLLIASCNQMSVGQSYERGFDQVLTTHDFRILLEQTINRVFNYELNLYKKKKVSESYIKKYIEREFLITLKELKKSFIKHENSLWPAKLRVINDKVVNGISNEINILKKDSSIIIKKMMKVPAGAYWYTLGKEKYIDIGYFFIRIIEAIKWRSLKLASKFFFFPILFLPHYHVIFGQILKKIINKISSIKDKNWHIHMHIMDVHDCRSINHLFHFIYRFKYFPRWLIAKVTKKTKHHFVYCSALMYVDECLEKIFIKMKQEKIFNDTLILITGDHGYQFAESPRKKAEVGNRTFYEDLQVPMILSDKKNKLDKDGMCDSMNLSATFLDILDVPLHKSYKGASVFKEAKEYVIAENCGRGNADIIRRDIYFTITSKKYKLMAVLQKKVLVAKKLFFLKEDPQELKNLVNKKSSKNLVMQFSKVLYFQRRNLFVARNIKKLIVKI